MPRRFAPDPGDARGHRGRRDRGPGACPGRPPRRGNPARREMEKSDGGANWRRSENALASRLAPPRRLRRHLGSFSSRQLSLVQEGLQAPLADLDTSYFQHLVHLRHGHALGPLLEHPLSQPVQDILERQLRWRQLRQIAVDRLEIHIRLVEASCHHSLHLVLLGQFLPCRIVIRRPRPVNDGHVSDSRCGPMERSFSLSLPWNP